MKAEEESEGWWLRSLCFFKIQIFDLLNPSNPFFLPICQFKTSQLFNVSPTSPKAKAQNF
jgi:hypothetical protein